MLFIHRFKERSKVKVYQLPKPRVMTMAAANDMKHKKADPTASTNAPIKTMDFNKEKIEFFNRKKTNRGKKNLDLDEGNVLGGGFERRPTDS